MQRYKPSFNIGVFVEVFDAEVARNFIWIFSVFLDMYPGP